MALERQLVFWVAALAVFVAVLWLLSDVLLPFVAGMALAYLLDPIARRAEAARHQPRGFGADRADAGDCAAGRRGDGGGADREQAVRRTSSTIFRPI